MVSNLIDKDGRQSKGVLLHYFSDALVLTLTAIFDFGYVTNGYKAEH